MTAPILWLGAQKLEKNQISTENKSFENRSKKTFMREPTFWFLSMGFACLAIAHSATLHHLLPILDERHIPAGLAILVAAAIGPMQVIGRLFMMISEGIFQISK